MNLEHTPVVRARRKSRWNPSAVDRAITEALRTSYRIPSSMAVLHEGEVIGLVRGDSLGISSTFSPITHRQWCGFNTYNDLNNAAKNGKLTRVYFQKDSSGWTLGTIWGDTWPLAGNPGAGTYAGAANTARQFDNTTAGGLWTRATTPAASETKHIVEWYLSHTNPSAITIRNVIVYDRVLTYDGASITTTLTTLTNTLPALRYIAAGQDGLLIAITCSAALGAVASNLSALHFTDQNGNGAVSLAPSYTLPFFTSCAAPTTTDPARICVPWNSGGSTHTPFLPFPGGVTGVRKVEDFTSSAINTGTICVGLYKPVAVMYGRDNITVQTSLARSMFALERVFDDACLAFMVNEANTNSVMMQGEIRMVHS